MESNGNLTNQRVVYFDENKTFHKLSDKIKDDSKNVFVSEGGVCLVEVKKVNTKINDTKVKELKDEHPLSKFPSQHLIKFIIRDILLYLDFTEILNNCLLLNKAITNMFKINLVTKTIQENKEYHGTRDANHIYSQFNMCDILQKEDIIYDLEINLETKDQGWASATTSSSWVELRFTNGKGEITTYAIAKNYREKTFKQVKLVISNRIGANSDSKLLNLFNSVGTSVQVVARSMFGGWEIYLKSFSIEFRLLRINRN